MNTDTQTNNGGLNMDVTLFLLTATAFYILGVAVGHNKENFEE